VTLAELLDRAALRRPETVAVVDGARRSTCADRRAQAARVAEVHP
jgi:non-ribosomal peptide synthetase component E (peptide arylation enzyme)